MTSKTENVIEYRFAPVHPEDCSVVNLADDDRLALLAVCIASQQTAGFRDYIDARQAPCPECGSPGFNTGWGVFRFTCGAEFHGDGTCAADCPNVRCPVCGGLGKTSVAQDLLARPPKEQQEYERGVMEQGKVNCAFCNGTGKKPVDN